MSELKESPRERLNKDLKTLFISIIVIIAISIISIVINRDLIQRNILLVIEGCVMLYLLVETIVGLKSYKDASLSTLKHRAWRMFITSIALIAINIFMSMWPGVWILLPVYVLSLIRNIHKVDNDTYDKKSFLDKFLGFLRFLSIVVFTIGSLLVNIYRQVMIQNAIDEARESYWQKQINENK